MLATTARSREVKSAGDPAATQKFVDSEFSPLVAAYLKAQDDFVRTLEQRCEQVRTDAFNRRVQYAITGLVLSVLLLAVGLAMAWQPPPRQNSCRLHRSTPGAAMKDKLGSIRTDIQRQSGSAVAAAGERSDRRGCAGDWDRCRHLGPRPAGLRRW